MRNNFIPSDLNRPDSDQNHFSLSDYSGRMPIPKNSKENSTNKSDSMKRYMEEQNKKKQREREEIGKKTSILIISKSNIEKKIAELTIAIQELMENREKMDKELGEYKKKLGYFFL